MDITSSNDARAAIESGWAEADFLALKQVNKRGKVRLNSPITSLEAWTGKTDIFAISNKLGCFAAGGDQTYRCGRWHAPGAALRMCGRCGAICPSQNDPTPI
ncbi:hypothetical protein BOTBODRAFT_349787 [Botryobasidium botryosum FD-172 SS1]|uniref:Uncharacterized protein n=1 Tax=Botryobasidium botryosum (strain FD-172 SS1) TaxID=930990 RepID=A0A067MI44_BOTB1|nr:hypothetical protein BOTBODRAFT_349787 [Botryobasidium botryosum FD-172 SS1]